MSDDGAYILRHQGRDRFFYVRWGGSYVDRDLLQGPERFLRFVEGLRPTPTPILVRWLSGLVLVDQDQQQVWFWSSQLPGASSMERRLLFRWLSAAWPAWTLRWMTHPAAQIAELLPQHPPLDCLQPPPAWTLDDFVALQEQPWREALAKQDDLPGLVTELGEALVRSWMESDTHRAAACLVTATGVHEVLFDDSWEGNGLLCTGPAALAALLARPGDRLERLTTEAMITSAYWIELETRQLLWWHLRPQWSDHAVNGAEARWPGWQLAPLEGGVFTLVQRLGREPRALLPSSAAELLHRMVERLVGPRRAGAEILAQAAAALRAELAPGETLTVTPPGPGSAGPAADGERFPPVDALLMADDLRPLSDTVPTAAGGEGGSA